MKIFFRRVEAARRALLLRPVVLDCFRLMYHRLFQLKTPISRIQWFWLAREAAQTRTQREAPDLRLPGSRSRVSDP